MLDALDAERQDHGGNPESQGMASRSVQQAEPQGVPSRSVLQAEPGEPARALCVLQPMGVAGRKTCMPVSC